ncbi:MAG: phage portal protein [Nitrosopumilus sp.]|nr:phage portal protein [Nitrosopumilus sp.]
MWLFDKIFNSKASSSSNSSTLDSRVGAAYIPSWGEGRPIYSSQDFQAQIESNIKWVYRCVELIAVAASTVPLKLYTMKSANNKVRIFNHKSVSKKQAEWLEAHNPSVNRLLRKSGELVQLTDHPIYELLKNVNDHMNEMDLKMLKWKAYSLTGNAYWYKVKNGAGRPVKLWPLPVPNMRVIPSKEKFIAGYELRNGADVTFFDESEVIHFKNHTPGDLFYGQSPMAAIVDTVTLQYYMDKFNRDLFYNKAIPEVVLKLNDRINDVEAERIIQRWKEKYSFMSGRSGEPAILSNGLEPYKLTMTPQELHYIESDIQVRNTIAGVYGVPITKFDPSLIKANTDAADTQFLRDTIYPNLIIEQEKLNEKLIPDFDSRIVAAYDNPIPEDKEYKLKEDVSLIRTGLRTRNELRSRDGLEPLPPDQGDVVPPFQSTGNINIGSEEGAKGYAKSVAKQVREMMYGKLSDS